MHTWHYISMCVEAENCHAYPVLLDNRCYHLGTISSLQHNTASLHYNNGRIKLLSKKV